MLACSSSTASTLSQHAFMSGSASIRRWTLASLASQQVPTTATFARSMLNDITTRLELQTVACEELQVLSKQDGGMMIQQHLDFLHYVHVDTMRQCRQVLDRDPLWPRWNTTDQRIVRQCFEQVRDRHAPSLERWVDIAIALQEQNQKASSSEEAMQLLKDVLQARFSIQLLTHHYSQMAQEDLSRRRPTGVVAVNHPLADLVHDAYTEANFLCMAHYQQAPELDLQIPEDFRVTVVRPWLTHTLVEVCKNAMCATVQKRHEQQQQQQPSSSPEEDDLPPLVVSAQVNNDGDENGVVLLNVIDHGTGLPVDKGPNWNPFGWGTSSARQRWDRIKEQQSYAAVRPPLASLGVGLPVSRAMLRHFGGDLNLLPALSGGCLAQITLPLNTHIPEQLPPHLADHAMMPAEDEYVMAEHEN